MAPLPRINDNGGEEKIVGSWLTTAKQMAEEGTWVDVDVIVEENHIHIQS